MNHQCGEETRAQILQAAAGAFAQLGYDATGVAEICRRARVSKGAAYDHFSSKHAVFLELLNRWLVQLDGQLLADHLLDVPVSEAILAMAATGEQVLREAQEQLPLFLAFWARAVHDPATWNETIAPYRRYQTFFADMTESGVAEGSLQPVDAELAARVIVSLAIGILLQGAFDPEGADWGHVLQAGTQLLLEGLARRE